MAEKKELNCAEQFLDNFSKEKKDTSPHTELKSNTLYHAKTIRLVSSKDTVCCDYELKDGSLVTVKEGVDGREIFIPKE